MLCLLGDNTLQFTPNKTAWSASGLQHANPIRSAMINPASDVACADSLATITIDKPLKVIV